MLKQLFATMNDTLDEVIRHYPTADDNQKQELQKKLDVLKSMSDAFIEQWLLFEEKLSHVLKSVPSTIETNEAPSPKWADGSPGGFDTLPVHSDAAELFKKGSGYSQLLMFDKAIIEFEKAIELAPDFLLARLHLAFMQMRKNNDSEAYRHFRFIVSLSEEAQMKAISYNAMGCIQAKHANMEQAQQLFKLSYTTDPSCVEPMINMGICMSQHQAEWNQPGSEYMH